MVNYSMTKEAKIWNGEMKVPSISGAGKTGQLHTKNEIKNLSYHIQKQTKIRLKS